MTEAEQLADALERHERKLFNPYGASPVVMRHAADELHRLSAELEALKKAAKQMVLETRKDSQHTSAHRVRTLCAAIDLENAIYAIHKEKP